LSGVIPVFVGRDTGDMKRDSAINMPIWSKKTPSILMAIAVCGVPSTKLHLSPTNFSQNIGPTAERVWPPAEIQANVINNIARQHLWRQNLGLFRQFACYKQGCV